MENKQVLAALLKAQMEIKPPEKDGTNPMFKSKYMTLDNIYNACRKPFFENGLLLWHTVEKEEDRYILITTLYHSSGESLSSRFPLCIERTTSQGMGSARTYACRYSICNLLALPSEEDDDGNNAESTRKEQPKQTIDHPYDRLINKMVEFKVPTNRIRDWIDEKVQQAQKRGSKVSTERVILSALEESKWEAFKKSYIQFITPTEEFESA